MNKEVANILKQKLIYDQFKFADVIAGMVQTVSYETNDGDGRKVIQKMPYTTDVFLNPECHIGKERAMVPDSQKKGIVYFEELGLNFVDRASNNHLIFKSKLLMVCWINKAQLVGDKYIDISTFAITQTIKSFNVFTMSNVGNFSRFNVTPTRILRQDSNVFSRYSYDENINQYLMPPFEFFAIELDISFSVNPKCVDKINFEDPICY